MKKWFFSILLLLPSIATFAQEEGRSVDEKIDSFFKPIADFIGSIIFVSFDVSVAGFEGSIPFVLLWLLGAAIFCMIYFRFPNFRLFGLAINIVRGKYSDPTEKGEVSHFQALATALSGTVGLGNIAGVAIAISIGGPGATFWMIVAGLIGMCTKFAECTLGVKYRDVDEPTGRVDGGPMYYLSKGFANLKLNFGGKEHSFWKMGKVLAIFFAIACIGGSVGGGNMFQINQATSQFTGLSFIEGSWLADNKWAIGVFTALVVGVVIIGGIKSIARVTDKIVPAMCLLYVLTALVILGYYVEEIPTAFGKIFNGAFNPEAAGGAIVGVMIVGFQRAAFSNEAGIGSASIAHSAVKTNNPASEGIVALLEPFIDTVIVCTMTALVIIITGANELFTGDSSTAAGIALTSTAFTSVISWFDYILAGAVILFAFSTMLSWSYYGVQATTYLFGETKLVENIYYFFFCGFIVLGASMELGSVVAFSDYMIFAMCLPNVVGIVFLAPVVKDELKRYLGKIDSGEIVRHN